jgi:hypothetical protein
MSPNDAMKDIERLIDEYARDARAGIGKPRKSRAALLAAIGKLVSSTQPAELWQPIETAPKDGTPILLGFPDSHSGEGRWMGDSSRNHWGEVGWFEFSDDVLCDRPSKPTHWQPLPPPPRSQVQGGLSTNNEEMK